MHKSFLNDIDFDNDSIERLLTLSISDVTCVFPLYTNAYSVKFEEDIRYLVDFCFM
jgi:hypothetical protein